jgi:hypothetical protein
LPLSHIRTPFLPILHPFSVLLQALLFFSQILMVIDFDHDGDWRSATGCWPGIVGIILAKIGEATIYS